MIKELDKSSFLCYYVCNEEKLHKIKKDTFDSGKSNVIPYWSTSEINLC